MAKQNQEVNIEIGSYEVIRDRLRNHSTDLQERLQRLNLARKLVFGATETKLKATERISTDNNCLARDIIPIGDNYFWFGYNVHMGLKSETHINDVFSTFHFQEESQNFKQCESELLNQEQFLVDFANLYQYYRETHFSKFARIGNAIFMVFQVGKTKKDIKTFKWAVIDGKYQYAGNRSDHEFKYPQQHEFSWQKVNRDMHRKGIHPHISIKDRVFIETTSGDLTLKIEDNTETGQGIYSEPVDEKDQTLDDAEIYFAIIGNLIAIKVKPYQEKDFRHLVYNEKIQACTRMDALEDSCVLLPDNQGIIFAKGYYIQTGEVKLFDIQLDNMLFERKIASQNGEDYLYIFYQAQSGIYILLNYNIIDQKVANPIICNGYTLFESGELIFFKAEEEQKRVHLIQIWQTPFYSPNHEIEAASDSYIYKIGNKEIVRLMSECSELVKLIGKDDRYANLYLDLSRQSTGIIDSYHWIGHSEVEDISKPIEAIKSTAAAAIDEYEKVVKIKAHTAEEIALVFDEAQKTISKIKNSQAKNIAEYVNRLALIRENKGKVIALKDLRYTDLSKIENLETELNLINEQLSKATLSFLLRKEALAPYELKTEKLKKELEGAKKVTELNRLAKDIVQISAELDLLIEIVGNLKIDDTTQSVQIIDAISTLYAQFNRISAQLKNRKKELLSSEGEAEFKSQIKLINQGLTNYLNLADSAGKCDEYLNKLMVQLEELEAKFAAFDEFIEIISEKREELYNAFDSKKVQLNEALNKKALSLQKSGGRIIIGIQKRLAKLKSEAEMRTFYASDLMIEKVRGIADQLLSLGDSVKADDILSQLKSSYEDALRQSKDKQELFVNGDNIIKLGKHQFNVNTQSIDLSIVYKDEDLYYHISGTNFFEALESEAIDKTRSVWGQALKSENNEVYRAEYLAYHLFLEAQESQKEPEIKTLEELQILNEADLLAYVQLKMGRKYDEGYIKGVHDKDGMLILKALVKLHFSIGLLRYSSDARCLALLFWKREISSECRLKWDENMRIIRSILKIFPQSKSFVNSIAELKKDIKEIPLTFDWITDKVYEEAANYLFHLLSTEQKLAFSLSAWELSEQFELHLKVNRWTKDYDLSLKNGNDKKDKNFQTIFSWLKAYHNQLKEKHYSEEVLREASILLMDKTLLLDDYQKVILRENISGLEGEHSSLEKGQLPLHYPHFMKKLHRFENTAVRNFVNFQKLKKDLLHQQKSELRLEEFKPKVMSSFVRNQLLDEVYLPLIGDNLAKQMGAAGANKRTDLMGMLLLISPPGYGKTTLMEYIANRMGLVFMKINGPAIGHEVTAIDPSVALNSAAREELEKLNLAFEMGDNVMIYIDDIQHCNPSFLQKFISLCDAQRKIEGIYKGVSKTYDFRGRKVAVVMAGNPYTESGDKFQIPDMLSNRADIYNLGDIIGGKAEAFENSYLENSLSSNPSIAKLKDQSTKDFKILVQAIESGDTNQISLEGKHSGEEIKEYLQLLQKMLRVRDVILKVNKQYILSAGQAEEYRTEPPFKLQGSYRDMNKMVEKLSPIMNEEELETLILSHYENESQSLSSSAEFNFLKLKELLNLLSPEEKIRKEEILEVFDRQQRMKSFGGNQIAPIIDQMARMGTGLNELVQIFSQYEQLKNNNNEPI
jgi:MoxR-like ATPase